MADSKIAFKLMHIQQILKAPKGQYNNFGKYTYRSAEDILEAVKPIVGEHGCTLMLTDEVVAIGEPVIMTSHTRKEELDKDKMPKLVDYTETQECHQRFYVKATVTLFDVETGASISTSAYAREEDTKKGMDGSQITGTASSYARKYALNGLFCIDDTKDADTDEYQKQTKKTEPTKAEPQKPQTKDADDKTKAEAELIVKQFETLSSEGFIKPSSLANMKMALGNLKTEQDYLMFIANCKKNIQDAEKAKAESFNDDKIPF